MSAFNHHLLRFQLIIIGHYCYHCEKSSCPPALDNLSLCFHFSKVIEDPVNKQKMFIFNGYSTDNVPRYGKSRRKQYNTSRGLFPPDLHRTERPRKASIRKMARSTWIPPPLSFVIIVGRTLSTTAPRSSIFHPWLAWLREAPVVAGNTTIVSRTGRQI